MLRKLLGRLEDAKRPLLGPNLYCLQFWGLLLLERGVKRYFYMFMHAFVIVFTVTEFIDIWFIKSDIKLVLHNLKITMLATVSVAKITTFLVWQKRWKRIMDYVTTADLNQRSTDDEKKKKVIGNITKYCRQITFTYWFLTYTTGVIVILQPVLKYLLSPTYREKTRSGSEPYLEVVSSWVPFDKSSAKGYLVASFIQALATVYASGWITSYDTNSIVCMVFFKGELQLLRKDCSDIFGSDVSPVADEIALERLKDCYRRHVKLMKYFHLLNSCLSPIMLLYMIVCSVMLCVTAYQITIETNPTQRLLIAEYLVFGVAQLFIYCWHSNDVFYASQDLLKGPYESRWWTQNASRRKNLFLFVAQCSQTIVFTAGPFSNLTVATFVHLFGGVCLSYGATILIAIAGESNSANWNPEFALMGRSMGGILVALGLAHWLIAHLALTATARLSSSRFFMCAALTSIVICGEAGWLIWGAITARDWSPMIIIRAQLAFSPELLKTLYPQFTMMSLFVELPRELSAMLKVSVPVIVGMISAIPMVMLQVFTVVAALATGCALQGMETHDPGVSTEALNTPIPMDYPQNHPHTTPYNPQFNPQDYHRGNQNAHEMW